jgi:CHAT domain-containing protein
MDSDASGITNPSSHHTLDRCGLRVPLQALATAQTTDALRNVLVQYPDMVSSWADDLLTQLIQSAWQRQQMGNVCIFTACRAFLARCRQIGCENALDRQQSLPLPASSPLAELLRLPKDDASILRRIPLYRHMLSQVRQKSESELWATLQYELANCLAQSQGPDRACRLEEAILRFQAVIEVWTLKRTPDKWAQVLHDLGSAFRIRVQGDRGENLRRAIRLYALALKVRTREAYPDEWAETQTCLGIAWKELPYGNRARNQRRAFGHHWAARSIWSRRVNPVGWARVHHNLGNLCAQSVYGNSAANLERAIKHYQLALKVRTREDHPVQWTMTQVGLANAYVKRIHGDRAGNLERAIELYEQALQVRTREARPAEWAETQYDLAVAYRHRLHGDRARNQEMAIQCYRLALEVYTRESYPRQWANVNNDLGTAYNQRLGNDRAENIECAIHHYVQSLKVRTFQSFPTDWATTQNNLANAYCDRIRGNRELNLERAIRHYNQALRVRTQSTFPYEWAMIHNNLGTAFWERVRGSHNNNLREAICHLNAALQVFEPNPFPTDARRAARNLGNLLFGEGRWTEAHAAYTIALQAAEALYEAAFMEAGREAEISENAALYAHDAFCLAHLGQLEEALIRLEEGKTRTLAERLGRDAVQLQRARPDDQKAYHDLLDRLKGLEAEQRAEGDSQSHSRARRPYTEIAVDVERIRQDLKTVAQRIQGYLLDFLPSPLDFAAIQALVPDEQTALVEFCATEKGSVILVVRQEGKPETVWMEGFTRFDLHRLLMETPSQVQSWLERYQRREENPEAWQAALSEITASQGQYQVGWQVAYQLAYQLFQVTPKDHPARKSAWLAWLATIERVLAEVGLGLIMPLHAELQRYDLTRLILIPQGSLFLLPLHAVPIDQNGACLLDRYEVSFAPSASVLQRCQERAAGAQTQGLFAVANPSRGLVFTRSEVEAIASLFGEHKAILEPNGGIKEKTLGQAGGHGYLHFSCHGKYDWSEPLRSALLLARDLEQDEEGRLTLAEIEEKLDLSKTRLVTLSACETGLSEALGPRAEEYVGLPAGFLLAGAPAVVASLWAVNDLSTALLIERFYRYHLEARPDPLPPAEALRRAQQWLRDKVTAAMAADACFQRVEALRAQEDKDLKSAQDALIHYELMPHDSRPFAHPVYWAPFTMSGQ